MDIGTKLWEERNFKLSYSGYFFMEPRLVILGRFNGISDYADECPEALHGYLILLGKMACVLLLGHTPM